MRWLDKMSDWATNKSNDYQKENNVYDLALNKICTIEDLLECYINEGKLLEFDEFRDFNIKIKSIKDSIFMYQKQISLSANEQERSRLKQEVLALNEDYKQVFSGIKEMLLNSRSISELNSHIMELNAIIKRNARFEIFQKYLSVSSWKLKDLEFLKNEMYKKKAELINYLGRLQ